MFQEVRHRIWGKSRLEASIDNSVSVPITELLKRYSDGSA
jgi:hypothetical protein